MIALPPSLTEDLDKTGFALLFPFSTRCGYLPEIPNPTLWDGGGEEMQGAGTLCASRVVFCWSSGWEDFMQCLVGTGWWKREASPEPMRVWLATLSSPMSANPGAPHAATRPGAPAPEPTTAPSPPQSRPVPALHLFRRGRGEGSNQQCAGGKSPSFCVPPEAAKLLPPPPPEIPTRAWEAAETGVRQGSPTTSPGTEPSSLHTGHTFLHHYLVSKYHTPLSSLDILYLWKQGTGKGARARSSSNSLLFSPFSPTTSPFDSPTLTRTHPTHHPRISFQGWVVVGAKRNKSWLEQPHIIIGRNPKSSCTSFSLYSFLSRPQRGVGFDSSVYDAPFLPTPPLPPPPPCHSFLFRWLSPFMGVCRKSLHVCVLLVFHMISRLSNGFSSRGMTWFFLTCNTLSSGATPSDVARVSTKEASPLHLPIDLGEGRRRQGRATVRVQNR